LRLRQSLPSVLGLLTIESPVVLTVLLLNGTLCSAPSALLAQYSVEPDRNMPATLLMSAPLLENSTEPTMPLSGLKSSQYSFG
jgi:hypothetical protein